MFKGAGERSARDIVEVIEARRRLDQRRHRLRAHQLPGARPGGRPAARPGGDRRPGAAADPGRRPTWPQEVGVIAQEIAEAADTPDDFVFELAQGAAFAGQPLGRPVLGTEASIARRRSRRAGGLARAALRARPAGGQRRRRGRRGRAAGAGRAAVRRRARRVGAPAPAPASFTGGRARRGAASLEQAHLVLLPAGRRRDRSRLLRRRALFAEALGGGMSSRLFQEARERLGLAYAIDAFADSLSGRPA